MSTTSLSFVTFVLAVFLAGAAVGSCLTRREFEGRDARMPRVVLEGACQ